MKRTTFLHSTVAAAACLAALPALADDRHADVDAAAAPGQVTMAQAVVIAESMGNGRATHAQFRRLDAGPVYRVRVQAQGEVPLKIDVAATDGRIVASQREKD